MVVVVSSWQASNIIWHLLTRLNAICVLISSLQQPHPQESWGVRWFSLSPAFIPHMLPPSLTRGCIVREVHGALHSGKQRKRHTYTNTHTHIPLGDSGLSRSALSVALLFDWISVWQTAASTCLSITTLSSSDAGEHVAVASAKTRQNEHSAHKWGCWQHSFFFFLFAACRSSLPLFFLFCRCGHVYLGQKTDDLSCRWHASKVAGWKRDDREEEEEEEWEWESRRTDESSSHILLHCILMVRLM